MMTQGQNICGVAKYQVALVLLYVLRIRMFWYMSKESNLSILPWRGLLTWTFASFMIGKWCLHFIDLGTFFVTRSNISG